MKQFGIRFQDLRLQITLLPARKPNVDQVDYADWRAYLIKHNALLVDGGQQALGIESLSAVDYNLPWYLMFPYSESRVY